MRKCQNLQQTVPLPLFCLFMIFYKKIDFDIFLWYNKNIKNVKDDRNEKNSNYWWSHK